LITPTEEDGNSEHQASRVRATVYRFQTWNRGAGLKVWATHMGTAEAIRKAKGEADLSSARIVDRHELDQNGLHVAALPPRTPSGTDQD